MNLSIQLFANIRLDDIFSEPSLIPLFMSFLVSFLSMRCVSFFGYGNVILISVNILVITYFLVEFITTLK